MRRLLVLALPAAVLPVTMAAPASAEAGPPAACASVYLPGGDNQPVETDCDPNINDPDHVVGAQVCADQAAAPDNEDDVSGDPISGMVIAEQETVEGHTVWVEGSGNVPDAAGGLAVGADGTAVGVSDDTGTQCNPAGTTP